MVESWANQYDHGLQDNIENQLKIQTVPKTMIYIVRSFNNAFKKQPYEPNRKGKHNPFGRSFENSIGKSQCYIVKSHHCYENQLKLKLRTMI